MGPLMQRDLRTGTSIWEGRRGRALSTSALRRSRRVDVLVIGAGISGALVAENLSAAGLDVVVVDRRGPAQGSTTASTALLQYELDTPLTTLSRRIGRERAERIWRRSRLAVDALHDRARMLDIDADLHRRETLYLEGTTLDARSLRREAEARRRAGFEAEYLSRSEVHERYGIARRAAIHSFGGLIADPRRLALGMLARAMERGTQLVVPVTVTELDSTRRGVMARTADGPTIRARLVVLATGYELMKGVPSRGHSAISTWAMTTRPQPGQLWPTECLIWEASDPYLYLRVGPRGEVICGGEDEDFDDEARRDALLPDKTRTLERKLKKLFPKLDSRAEYAWTGTFGTSTTGSPTIGPLPRMPGCFAVLGYGGNGITFSMMAAQMLCSMITGVGDCDADLVSFTRQFGFK
jgi:glycine/D-amino acid oxidase-like deaminating enzyme